MTDDGSKPCIPDFSAIFKSVPDLYLLLSPKFEIVGVSDAYLRATMVKREEILGKGIFEIFPDNPNDLSATGERNLKTSLNRVLENKIPDTMAVQKYDIRRPVEQGGDFEERYWSPVNSPILDPDGNVIYILHRAEDVTEFVQLKKIDAEQKLQTAELRSHVVEMEIEIFRRAQEIQETNKKLELLALFDVLTGLANRKKLTEEIKKSLAFANEKNWNFAMLFLDVDQFKLINDTLGHKAGDTLLQIVAKRITNKVQKTDVVARMGGDEFVILLNRVKDVNQIIGIVERILEAVKKPISVENHKLFISASIGISIFPQDGKDEVTLLKHADIAMYRAKQLGRNGYQFCSLEMIQHIRNKMDLEHELRNALNNDRFVLHYQPQIDLRTGRIVGVEALIRLSQPDGSLLLPAEFLTVAEESSLIVPIGEWVVYTAFEQFKYWEKHKDIKDEAFRLAINFSARQLKEPHFFDRIKKALSKSEFNPNYFELEVTENPIISNVDVTAKIFQQLNEIGVKISLDDFGIGYSSLNYLRQFPIDTLKIDISLIQNISFDEADTEIIKSIINMAHAKKISVVAEGVSTPEQLRFLIEHHCDKVQSHYFSNPLASDEMTQLLRKNHRWELSPS